MGWYRPAAELPGKPGDLYTGKRGLPSIPFGKEKGPVFSWNHQQEYLA